MKVIRNMEEGTPCVLALGMFDGVHRGHMALLRLAREEAEWRNVEAAVWTFDRIPAAVLRPEKGIRQLTTEEERLELLAQAGMDRAFLIPFDRETAAVEPEAFLREVRDQLKPVCLVAGYDYSFGRYGRGNTEMLEAFGRENGIDVRIVPPVEADGSKISSTRIRDELAAGNVKKAAELLGHPYGIFGRVVRGKGMGKTLGYPTANIGVSGEKLLPAFGVYACELVWEDQRHDAVVNIGLQPTLPSGNVTVEAFIPDGEYDLREKPVWLFLKDRLRGEKKFESVDALKKQIAEDIKKAKGM